METQLIVAAALNRVIGKNNQLIWHLPVDMKFFKETTMGYPVIMGRKNFESIPDKFRPFSGRLNIVVSRQGDYPLEDGVKLSSSLEQGLEIAERSGAKKCYVIGGGEIYKEALDKGLIHKMIITWVEAEPEGDTYFPEFDISRWKCQTLMHHPADDRHPHSMKVVEYVLEN